MKDALLYILAIFNLVSMAHLGMFIVGANAYDIKQYRRRRQFRASGEKPLVSVVIPAHNESVVIKRTLDSVLASSYKNIEVVVVDDGSKDNTPQILREYISTARQSRLVSRVQRTHIIQNRGLRRDVKSLEQEGYTLRRSFEREPISIRLVKVSQKNAGKAAAMNNAIANYVRGDLTMCLDADAVLHPKAIERAVGYFDNPKVIGVAANVRLVDTGTLLSKVQRFEHLVGYRSKKFYSMTNTEFIIGGVASTYRTDVIKQVGLYDCDTATEDIGLSMKMIATLGNKDKKILYAADVVAATEGVHSFSALMRQRYRWKIGCLQNLFKYRQLIGRGETGKHGFLLTKYRLPMALLGEMRLILEPLLLAYVIYLSVHYWTVGILLGAYLTITLYVLWNVWPDEHLTLREKISMSGTSMFMYMLFYIMDVVQIVAIYRCLRNYRQITAGNAESTWVSPARANVTLAFNR